MNIGAYDGSSAGFITNNGKIQQTVTVDTEGDYRINFKGVAMPDPGSATGVTVLVDGVAVSTIGAQQLTNSTWTDLNGFLHLTAGAHTIAFQGVNPGGSTASSIDNVLITPVQGSLGTGGSIIVNGTGTLDLGWQYPAEPRN